MVVGLALAAVQMGMALPTGFLFGVGYGTGVRIGYEQVYPLLFPKGARSTTSELAATMKGMNTVYDAIGGKDASRMGIAVGITNAGEILNNPDFRVLEKLESSSSGLTSLNSTPLDSVSNLSSPQPDPSFSSVPQLGSIFFDKPSLTLQEKEFLIKQIQQSISISDLLNMRGRFTDPNLIQVIEARIRAVRGSAQFIEPNTTPVPLPDAPFRSATQLEQQYNAWQSVLSAWQELFLKSKNFLLANKSLPSYNSHVLEAENNKSRSSSAIRKISEDYRNTNNTIRTLVLKLRQEIANGNWK